MKQWVERQKEDYRDFSFDLYGFRHEFDELVRTDKKILEIGCGNGYFLQRLEKKGYNNLWGIDVVEGAINDSKARATTAKIIQMDAHSTDFADGCFDVIVASHIFEHSPLPDVLVKELKRISRQKATWFIEIPIQEKNSDDAHYSFWESIEKFRRFLLKHDLEIIKEKHGYDKIDDREVGGKENHYYVVVRCNK